MKKVTIYSSGSCPYCIMAKELLEEKHVEIEELRIDLDSKYVDEAVERSGGRRTVPQVFIGDNHVGGYDELRALDDKGELDSLLTP